MNKKIILASQSPRRQELMNLLGLDFIIHKSTVEEIVDPLLSPEEVAIDLAVQKAEDVFASYQNDLVLGFDTIVVIGDAILGKPKDDHEAKDMLRRLSGKMHQVITGVAIISSNQTETYHASTDVYFEDITDQEIDRYIASNEHIDKAGGYAIQGKAAIFVREIQGDFYNVMGLPVASLYQKLKTYQK